MTVIVLTALLAVAALVIAIVASLAAGPVGLLFGLFALLPGSAALGLWRGNRGARVVGILIGVAAFSASKTPDVYSGAVIIYGVSIILLLVAPRSSRAWFTPRR